MNNIEKYIDFLDNKLESNDEQKFAENLAMDSDFRNDFKKYLVLTNALSASSKSYVPSIETKKAVFSSLGFTVGALDSPKINKKKTDFLKGRFFTMFTTAITTFVFTALLFRFFDTPVSESKILSNVNTNLTNKLDKNEFINTPIFDTIKNINKPTHISKKKLLAVNNNKQLEKEIISEIKNSQESGDIKSNGIELSQVTDNNQNLLAFAQKKDNNDLKKVNLVNDDQQLDTIYFIRSYDSKIRFEFKNTPSWFSQSPTLQPSRQNNFNNLSVSLYYPIYKTLLLGLDFRQETFYVEYDGEDNKGIESKFYQYPNLSTYGISLRYSPFNIGNELKPFGQLFMGANSTGIISRQMIGLEYYPFENVYFLIGGELNQFYFTHSNNWFTSSKYSLNYGIGVKF